MRGSDLRQCLNRRAKVIEPGVAFGVVFLSFDELSQPLDQIQVGGVGRQVEQGHSQSGGQSLYRGVSLVARVVRYECDQAHQSQSRDLAQQFAQGRRVDHRSVGYGDQLARYPYGGLPIDTF